MSKANFINKYLEAEQIDEATNLTYAGVKDLLGEVYDRDVEEMLDCLIELFESAMFVTGNKVFKEHKKAIELIEKITKKPIKESL